MNFTQKFQRIIAIEKQRYKNKGPKNTIIAIILFLSFIWIANKVGR